MRICGLFGLCGAVHGVMSRGVDGVFSVRKNGENSESPVVGPFARQNEGTAADETPEAPSSSIIDVRLILLEGIETYFLSVLRSLFPVSL